MNVMKRPSTESDRAFFEARLKRPVRCRSSDPLVMSLTYLFLCVDFSSSKGYQRLLSFESSASSAQESYRKKALSDLGESSQN